MTSLRDRTESNIKYEPASKWRDLICIWSSLFGDRVCRYCPLKYAEGGLKQDFHFILSFLDTLMPLKVYLDQCIK